MTLPEAIARLSQPDAPERVTPLIAMNDTRLVENPTAYGRSVLKYRRLHTRYPETLHIGYPFSGRLRSVCVSSISEPGGGFSMPRWTQTFEERFWCKVDKNGSVPAHAPELGPCWLWIGAQHHGYGSVRNHYKDERAHRVAYELEYGIDPGGNLVCHKCDVKLCVRGSHLYLGDHRTNALDASARGQMKKGDQHPWHLRPELLKRGDENGSRTHPERLARGSAAYGAKLTEVDIPVIRGLAASGVSCLDIARQLGVHKTTIYYVLSGKTWRHVP